MAARFLGGANDKYFKDLHLLCRVGGTQGDIVNNYLFCTRLRRAVSIG